jgi:EAL domain-containing protein (putative c-di-GMP-specific phosphodiesterase class I)
LKVDQSLGMSTVGEGVEEKDQSEMLRTLGCDKAQGWLHGRPGPASGLQDIVKLWPPPRPCAWPRCKSPI